MLVDGFFTQPHYQAHWQTVLESLPNGLQGRIYTKAKELPNPPNLTLVASFGDLRDSRGRGGKHIFCEHGSGASYSSVHPSYAGARDRRGVVLFLSPNHFAADRNAKAHPEIPQEIVGDPGLSTFRKRRARTPLVVVSWHWPCVLAPETQWAFPYYERTLRLWNRWAQDDGFRIAGHAHPRAQAIIYPAYRRNGIETIDTFDEVLRRADLYAVDNSSTLWEFAATRRPVLTLNAPWYRRGIDHGLRFWQAIPGLQVNRPHALREAIRLGLEDAPEVRRVREEAVRQVYPVRGIHAAVEAIVRYCEEP
jgi:hypothetical protein